MVLYDSNKNKSVFMLGHFRWNYGWVWWRRFKLSIESVAIIQEFKCDFLEQFE